MSNKSVIDRILEIIEAFEHGDTCASAVAASVELHESALEAIPREVRDKMRALSVEVIKQDVTPIEEEMLGWKDSREALHELKSLLISLT